MYVQNRSFIVHVIYTSFSFKKTSELKVVFSTLRLQFLVNGEMLTETLTCLSTVYVAFSKEKQSEDQAALFTM